MPSWGAKVCQLGAALCVATAAAHAQTSPAAPPPLTPDQTKAVEQMIRDYLLRNPQIVVEALEAAKQQAETLKEASTRQALEARHNELVADPSSPVGGNPDGDVTLVEFFDYRCPYCKQVEPSLEALIKEDSKLRVVYKEFPILGPASVFAARVALAARKQGKYAAFHDAMMATKGEIDVPVILDVAHRAGLDLDRLKQDMLAPDITAIIRRDYELASALAIDSTPGFIVGHEIAEGAADIGALRRMIAGARAPD